MLKLIVTDVGVSKGYGDNPAVRFFEREGSPASVRFRIGKRIYDSRCEDNYRWINLNVKAFGDVCERIRKMKLKEGSFVNIIGRYDEETWEDKNTHEQRTTPVLIVDEIEYCYAGEGKKDGQADGEEETSPAQNAEQRRGSSARTGQKRKGPEPPPAGDEQEEYDSEPSDLPENFTGFEGFGGFGSGTNPFFPS